MPEYVLFIKYVTLFINTNISYKLFQCRIKKGSMPELPCYLENRENQKKSEFENWPKKIGEKSGNSIKLTDWESPIKRTSCQCWKQNMSSLGLESHICDFSSNSQKSTHYFLFNLQKSANPLSDYCGIPWWLKILIVKLHKTLDCWFRIFGFSGHFKKEVCRVS